MSQKKINVVVAGATGYVGLDLVYLLSKHPYVSIKYLCAQKNLGKKIKFFDKRIKNKLPKITNLKEVDWKDVDLLFLSLPNGEAQKIIKDLYGYKHLKFIDLSADFRIENSKIYKKWYSINHKAKNLISESIYSIPEFTKEKIKKYRIVSNPGCYPTSIQLVMNPLLKSSLINSKNITIDSKSGYSGAGKNFKLKFSHKNFYNSIFAYGIEKHRHMSELDQEFKKNTKKDVQYTFNPHLLPTFRGILSSIYIETKKKFNIKKVHSVLKKFHYKNKFVILKKINSAIGNGDVLNTNNCEISVCKTRVPNKLVIFSAIDNLVKGASGQAIQNMNLLYNYEEYLGLK
ncbi:MAG: N-acetyl-gamma-glutamyl-phosphate reductase [Pelagibacteraceae bacterium]|jgi:N-acetyl-gamma-glutamyl-phosphate reductase|nr:N-acetyl-gamma-glutamyl-phosphate reductase [Pelagibacteraceae bacterium]